MSFHNEWFILDIPSNDSCTSNVMNFWMKRDNYFNILTKKKKKIRLRIAFLVKLLTKVDLKYYFIMSVFRKMNIYIYLLL